MSRGHGFSDPTTILLAFAPLATDERIDDLRARFPNVDVIAVPYEVDHETSNAVAAAPLDPAVRARLPVPTRDQRAAFAAADVLLALDGPPALGALAPRLRLVQAVGSGVAQWRACGLDPDRVAVCNAAGLTAPAVSEWALAHVLRVLKRIDRVAELQRGRLWERTYGRQLAGRRLAVVGLGAIGSAVAVRAAAFGVEVHGVRRSGGVRPAGVAAVHQPGALHSVLSHCEIVISCLPGIDATADLFDQAAFAAMPAGTIFVNVGRGVNVDEVALVAALRSGHLGAACLDVTKDEPLPPDSPLWDCPRLYVSPHSAASPEALFDGLWDRFIANVTALVDGGLLLSRIPPTSF